MHVVRLFIIGSIVAVVFHWFWFQGLNYRRNELIRSWNLEDGKLGFWRGNETGINFTDPHAFSVECFVYRCWLKLPARQKRVDRSGKRKQTNKKWTTWIIRSVWVSIVYSSRMKFYNEPRKKAQNALEKVFTFSKVNTNWLVREIGKENFLLQLPCNHCVFSRIKNDYQNVDYFLNLLDNFWLAEIRRFESFELGS